MRRALLAVIVCLALAAVAYYLATSTSTVKLRVATTTSLYATGLLERLAEEFRKEHPNVVVQFIPVGSGEALRRAAQGDADLVFVHAPALERKYVEQGALVNWTIIAYNYFVVVGPADDPARVRGLDPVEAFKSIYEAGEQGVAMFVSRGDNSGTHQRELTLWKLSGLDPHGRPWYVESGTGMAETLLIAEERGGYTLSDIGTFLKLKAEGRLPHLEVLVEEGDILVNVYSAYLVSPSKVPGVNYELATELVKFVASERGQEIIERYGEEEYGQPLFRAAAGREEWLRGMWSYLASQG